jgi:hypothetical protein
VSAESITMPSEKFTSGAFAGVATHDTFALAALNESPVVVKLPKISFPDNLAPAASTFSGHKPGDKITTALNEPADVLILLYTDLEISALLDVFTRDSTWSPTRKKTWYGYGHNFGQFKGLIHGGDDNALNSGILGFLFPMTIGNVRVVLYKTELHPKNNGKDVPFIPVIKQLVGELAPKLVISTGTAGAVGSHLQCGDVIVTSSARLHLRETYSSPLDKLNTLSQNNTELKNTVTVNDKYVKYAAKNFTKLSLPGLQQCYSKIGRRPEYSFLKKNTKAPSIYVKGMNPVAGPQPMDIVSGDYLTVDDKNNSEGLQNLGAMNDTDDAFAFFAIGELPSGEQPKWLSIRNASEPQIVVPAFPSGTTPGQIIDKLKSVAGAIYGVYQYCTTLNSAFACWGVIAGMN